MNLKSSFKQGPPSNKLHLFVIGRRFKNATNPIINKNSQWLMSKSVFFRLSEMITVDEQTLLLFFFSAGFPGSSLNCYPSVLLSGELERGAVN